MRVLCSSRKPMRKVPFSGFPRALLSLSHARKRRALGSKLSNDFVERNQASGLVLVPVGFLTFALKKWPGTELLYQLQTSTALLLV